MHHGASPVPEAEAQPEQPGEDWTEAAAEANASAVACRRGWRDGGWQLVGGSDRWVIASGGQQQVGNNRLKLNWPVRRRQPALAFNPTRTWHQPHVGCTYLGGGLGCGIGLRLCVSAATDVGNGGAHSLRDSGGLLAEAASRGGGLGGAGWGAAGVEGRRAGLVAVRTVHAWTASREEEAWREQVGGQHVSQRTGTQDGQEQNEGASHTPGHPCTCHHTARAQTNVLAAGAGGIGQPSIKSAMLSNTPTQVRSLPVPVWMA